MDGAGGGIRTHEPLRDEVLSLAPLTRLGDSRAEGFPPSRRAIKNANKTHHIYPLCSTIAIHDEIISALAGWVIVRPSSGFHPHHVLLRSGLPHP